jgi:hypothetical protein
VKQHTKPCSQCPWRRKSAAGWLGASTAEEFVAQGESDIRMPCHTHVDYEREDWAAQAMLAPQCAGRAVYLRNKCKVPRDPILASFVRTCLPDKEVFSWPHEFIAHHTKFSP